MQFIYDKEKKFCFVITYTIIVGVSFLSHPLFGPFGISLQRGRHYYLADSFPKFNSLESSLAFIVLKSSSWIIHPPPASEEGGGVLLHYNHVLANQYRSSHSRPKKKMPRVFVYYFKPWLHSNSVSFSLPFFLFVFHAAPSPFTHRGGKMEANHVKTHASSYYLLFLVR
ncbi:hypothetical protein CEXT_522661 [Caerostris extrusa]|uniref:Uncharacterized protein n=1 Tax=Caerostris extrusa TaxID=172846 RepID=A0AAV4MQ82_CAEEX|nr:hypothetical protein CEXT_522661 [Caerostris extrusa]